MFTEGAIVRHKRTQERYRVLFTPERSLVKIADGAWLCCYVYRRELQHNGHVFTKDQESFEANFEAV